MTARRTHGLVWLAAVTLVTLAVMLSACGRQGSLKPPKGESEAYTYPLFYPAPDTVVPSSELPAEEVQPGKEVKPATPGLYPDEEPRKRKLSPIPRESDRIRTETFR